MNTYWNEEAPAETRLHMNAGEIITLVIGVVFVALVLVGVLVGER